MNVNMHKKNKKLLAVLLSGAMLFGVSGNGFPGENYGNFQGNTSIAQAEEAAQTTDNGGDTVKAEELLIDGSTVNTLENMRFIGVGAVSCNNSSRLMMDYKEEHPKAYWEIMNWLFKPDYGVGMTHVKVELGCDLDTSSGAEPATKRTRDEEANVSRGAGFMFAHDAQTINPAVKVELLRWGEPGWISASTDENGNKSAQAIYQARYQWIKETMDAAYKTYGMKIDYIGANQNERSVFFPDISKTGEISDKTDNPIMWTIYLANALKNETTGAYDFSQVKVTSADQVDTTDLLNYLLYDRDIEDGVRGTVDNEAREKTKCEIAKQLRDSISVVGIHYDLNLRKGDKDIRHIQLLTEEYGKEFWHAEGSPAMTSGRYGHNATNEGSDMSGAGGVLNVANRIIAGYCNSSQTLYLYQPSVAAYYDGVVYFPKQLMTANTPWSGYYSVDAGVPATMHFVNFIKKGWQYVDSGCLYDGETSGHTCGTTRSTYLTATDQATGDYSTVITNDSADTRVYQVTVKNLAKAGEVLNVWETRQADAGAAFDSNWMKQIESITPAAAADGSYTYKVEVKPYSMITLTTTRGQKSYGELAKDTRANQLQDDTVLALPYGDDFSYAKDYLERRGGTPKYTTDLNGAFEVVTDDTGNQVLRQKINADNEPVGWGGKSAVALTSLGDDRWSNYTVSLDTRFTENPQNRNKNQVQLVARYNANTAQNGFYLQLFQSGKWTLSGRMGKLASGTVSIEDGQWNNLKISVNENEVVAMINGEEVARNVVKEYITGCGRVAIISAYETNEFDNLKVEPVTAESIAGEIAPEGTSTQISTYAKRLDDLADELNFSADWARIDSQSYTYYGRTISTTQEKGATLSFDFTGTGVHLLGVNIDEENKPAFKVTLDGKVIEKKVEALMASNRQCIYMLSGLSCGPHTITFELMNKNKVTIDAVEILQDGSSLAEYFTLTDQVQLDLAKKNTLTLNPVFFGTESMTYTYEVENTKIAQVDEKGQIKAKKPGSTKVRVVSESGYARTCYLTVIQSPKELKVKNSRLELKVKDKKTISYKLLPASTTEKEVVFKSSNKKVAKVSGKGVVTAVGKGTCTITVKAVAGKKAADTSKTVEVVVK